MYPETTGVAPLDLDKRLADQRAALEEAIADPAAHRALLARQQLVDEVRQPILA